MPTKLEVVDALIEAGVISTRRQGFIHHKDVLLKWWQDVLDKKVVKLAVLDPTRTDNWLEVHRDGCRHLNRFGKGRIKLGEGATLTAATSRAEAAAEVAAPFIAAGDKTLAQAVAEIHWADCLADFPEGDVSAVEAAATDAPRGRKAAKLQAKASAAA